MTTVVKFVTALSNMWLLPSRTLLFCIGVAILSGTIQAAPKKQDIKLSVFDCDLIGIEDVSSFGIINIETPVRELFVPCYLIQHPDGLMVWDTGLSPTLAGQGKVEVGGGFSIC
jgi:N-acyl homoserine lactone hydrolase